MKKTIILLFSLFLVSQTMTQWVNNYWGNNSGDNDIVNSKGLAIATDNHKNCYVAGYTTNPVTGCDIILIKYTDNGDTVFSRTFSGTGNGEDKAFGIAVDESDNIYLTGQVYIDGLGLELIVLKYNGNGNLLWYKTYGATGLNYDDVGQAIDVSENDRVYITGYSTGEDGFKNIVTIRYNSNGTQVWVNNEDGDGGADSEGFGIAVDEDNKIYVAGYITSMNRSAGKDAVIIKYSQNGNENWIKIYNGEGSGDDVAYDIAVDGDNKIYMTGYTTVNISQNNTDIILQKLNSNGSVSWTETYNEGNGISTDRAFGIIVDGENDIYITGEATNNSEGKNYLVLKYRKNGSLKWATPYNGPVSGDDYSTAISLTHNRVVVTGASWGTQNNFDYATLKIKKNNGVIQDIDRYSFSGNTNDIAKDVAVSRGNIIYVTGYSELVVDNIESSSAISTVMIKDNDEELNAGINEPEMYSLYQNFPNPFNPSTTIKFDISKDSFVKLTVYDVLGRSIDILVNNELRAGRYSISYTNRNLSTGIYFYELIAGNYKDIKKMSLIK